MCVDKVFQKPFARVRMFFIVNFCLILIENTWGWKLPSNKSLVVHFLNFGGTRMIAGNIQKILNIEFAAKNDFTGKTVYFFSTYSEDAGIAMDEMKEACPHAAYGSSLKVELRTPLHDEKSVMIPNDIIKNGLRR
jgi:hypothetical protein